MLELHTTILTSPCEKFELYSDGAHSSKIKRVMFYRFRNPDRVPGRAHWVYECEINIDSFIKSSNEPSAILSGYKDNSVDNIKEYCGQYQHREL